MESTAPQSPDKKCPALAVQVVEPAAAAAAAAPAAVSPGELAEQARGIRAWRDSWGARSAALRTR
jgi:hypothetical protein